MDNYYFCKFENMSSNTSFLNSVENYANTQKVQIYVISGPLTDKKYKYSYNNGYILLTSKLKITFIKRIGTDDGEFEEFIEDVKDDISFISDKYQFKDILGRKRTWDNLFEKIEEPLDGNFINLYSNLVADSDDYRKLDILISLFIGSINDAKQVTISEPDNILDKVKKKIQLFDTDQTRFIYDDIRPEKKIIKIQGLSGTGKTELLLHKLKDLYITDAESKICITCHNKVLADSLSKRIPKFFNFMKVEQQIEWNIRLLCCNAWGRIGDEDSGALRHICSFYNIPFMSLKMAGSFKNACEKAYENIQKKIQEGIDNEFVFTYMFVDESQDFNDAFFKLCELVTEKRVYIAGDIFQSIFEDKDASIVDSDFLLSRCYRTDPKTLMFAQGLGMGLFEEKKLWWLEEDMWKICGYNVNVISGGRAYELSREPIRRFEDVSSDFNSLKIISTNTPIVSIILQIKKLKKEFPNLQSSDIGIIFLDNDNYVYEMAPLLGNKIQNEFDWTYNLAHETKEEKSDTVFISNRNNVKGLEFPFVFCYTRKISREYSYRNSLYTMISRSFVRSYLFVNQSEDNGLTKEIIEGAVNIMTEKKMTVLVPSEEEKDKIRQDFSISKNQIPLRERVESIMKNLNIPSDRYEKIITFLNMIGVNNKSDDVIVDFIKTTNKTMDE